MEYLENQNISLDDILNHKNSSENSNLSFENMVNNSNKTATNPQPSNVAQPNVNPATLQSRVVNTKPTIQKPPQEKVVTAPNVPQQKTATPTIQTVSVNNTIKPIVTPTLTNNVNN